MEGLWTIEFGSNIGVFGSGVIVLRNGRIEGGDSNYFYLGSYEKESHGGGYPTKFRATISAKPFMKGSPSVFKTVDREFTLRLEGSLRDEGNGTAVGKPEGMPGMDIGIRLTRRSSTA